MTAFREEYNENKIITKLFYLKYEWNKLYEEEYGDFCITKILKTVKSRLWWAENVIKVEEVNAWRILKRKHSGKWLFKTQETRRQDLNWTYGNRIW
jgi:hypothetical protein